MRQQNCSRWDERSRLVRAAYCHGFSSRRIFLCFIQSARASALTFRHVGGCHTPCLMHVQSFGAVREDFATDGTLANIARARHRGETGSGSGKVRGPAG